MADEKKSKEEKKKEESQLKQKIKEMQGKIDELEAENKTWQDEVKTVNKSFSAMEDELKKLQKKKGRTRGPKEFNVVCKHNCDRFTNFRVKIKSNRLESKYFAGKAVK